MKIWLIVALIEALFATMTNGYLSRMNVDDGIELIIDSESADLEDDVDGSGDFPVGDSAKIFHIDDDELFLSERDQFMYNKSAEELLRPNETKFLSFTDEIFLDSGNGTGNGTSKLYEIARMAATMPPWCAVASLFIIVIILLGTCAFCCSVRRRRQQKTQKDQELPRFTRSARFDSGYFSLSANPLHDLFAGSNRVARIPSNLLHLLLDQDAAGYYCIHRSIRSSKREEDIVREVDLLLGFGVHRDIRDAQGATPLMTAVRYGKPLVAEHLLNLGANASIPDKMGKTVALEASEQNELRLLKRILIETKSDDSGNRSLVHKITFEAAKFAGNYRDNRQSPENATPLPSSTPDYDDVPQKNAAATGSTPFSYTSSNSLSASKSPRFPKFYQICQKELLEQ